MNRIPLILCYIVLYPIVVGLIVMISPMLALLWLADEYRKTVNK